MLKLGRANPQLHAGMLGRFDGFRRSLTVAAARRQGQQADDEEPGLIAALALATVHSALERWSGDLDGDDSPLPYVERSVALLHTMLT